MKRWGHPFWSLEHYQATLKSLPAFKSCQPCSLKLLNLLRGIELLRPDEVDHIDKLFAETMEDSIDPPETRYDPRYGLYPSTTEPILMALGPRDIEVAVAASIGSEVPAEEIVDNKTVRVDGEEQPSKTPGDHKICQGCTTTGHTLSGTHQLSAI